MSADRSAWTTHLRAVALYLAGVCLFLLFAVQWYLTLRHTGRIPFPDATVYARAIVTWQAGGNPYALSSTALPFVYPPLFLHLVGFVGSLCPHHAGWYGYLTLQAVTFLTVPWLLTTVYIRSRWLTPFFALLLFTFQPTFIEQFVLLTGNIANIFYPLALAAGIAGVKRNRWLPFYLVVAIAALLKPTFLDLLILPLLAAHRQLTRSVACTICVGAVYLLQRIVMPLDYARFQHNVFTQIVIRQDSGFNIFTYLHNQGRTIHVLNNPLVPSAVHIGIIGALLAAFVLLRNRRHLPPAQDLWLPALLVTTILANPRLQHIDAAIAILPAIFLCVEGVRRLPQRTSSFIVIATSFTVFASLAVKQFEMGLLVLLYISVLLALYLLFIANIPRVEVPSSSQVPEILEAT
jgi:hypothetical protein